MPNPLERRLLRVIDHIHRNPAGDLSLDARAEVAAMSRFHWHRCCRVLTGETVAQHVRRIGLERAAMPLIGTPDRVARIARAVGDPNAASFARAFRDRLGRATTAFRRRGLPPDTHLPPALKAFTMFPVEIIPRPALRLAALEHRGDDNRIGESFAKLSAHLAANGHMPRFAAGSASIRITPPKRRNPRCAAMPTPWWTRILSSPRRWSRFACPPGARRCCIIRGRIRRSPPVTSFIATGCRNRRKSRVTPRSMRLISTAPPSPPPRRRAPRSA